ncbi:unnamed protein product [Euphydryas editha]|uniref:Uncharacterized protein n=1 Tax=Euphydryas editha TaxID=104508 RepID=A0AAU9U4M7_EUPED|nr:unnamed protein product [Euphydryas editha]
MDVVCQHCGALKFAGETPGLCYLSDKVKLPLLVPPPKPTTCAQQKNKECRLPQGRTLGKANNIFGF